MNALLQPCSISRFLVAALCPGWFLGVGYDARYNIYKSLSSTVGKYSM